MAVLLTPPNLKFTDDSGNPLAFGKVYTYAATGGTFSTLKATYTDASGVTAAPNPVILDASGSPATGLGGIWLEGSYDFRITDANDVQIDTQLAVSAFSATSSSTDAYFQSFSGTGSQTSFTTLEDLGTDEKTLMVFVDNAARDYVTNGTFATDTGWTKGSGWTIGAGVATATTASSDLEQTASFTLEENNVYTITYTITRSAGTITPKIGGTSGTTQNSAGTYTETIIAGSTQTIAFTGSSFSGTVDNVSIVVANPKGYEIQSTSDFTIDTTTLTFTTAPASGTNNIYVFAPSLLVGAASSAAADAEASAAAALASENQAGAYAGQLTITSTTSLAIGTGSKTFTVSSGLSLNAGQFILIASDAAPTTNYMWGKITSYSGTTLQVSVAAIGGSGTYADWTMYLTGERGATGANGATGSISDLSGVPAGTITTSDKIIFDDVDDSNNTKSSTVSDLLALGGGDLVLLATATASASSSIDFTSNIDSTYAAYVFFIDDIIPANNNVQLSIRTSADGGSTFDSGASDYSYCSGGATSASGTFIGTTSTGSNFIKIGQTLGTDANEQANAVVILHRPSSTKYTMITHQISSVDQNGVFMSLFGGGMRLSAAAVDAIQFLMESGNIESGTIRMYGVKAS